ncbi:MAG: tRNA (adenosine(37)-N6)-threonylcarbamoyltransferase complex ATPase subunit type 1 TsaE [bacterium]|nr:tRNA (adenosine(37)-N6)-threonylcarbamoyltransferase complex ATPase subunit type 1 TsaE [bacterium]
MSEHSQLIRLRGLPATQRLAESVAAVVQPGDVLGLDGDLGCGKTTFVRYLARALGVTAPVTSPTFTLANTYEACPAPGAPLLTIHHLDAYRLDGDADAEDLALGELFDSGGVVVVEWAERLTLPPDRLDLHFAFPEEIAEGAAAGRSADGERAEAVDHRVVTVIPRGVAWQTRYAAVGARLAVCQSPEPAAGLGSGRPREG